MEFNPRKKSRKAVSDAAKVAADGDMYNFNLWISRLKMQKYMAVCKFRGKSAAAELNRFIDKELKKYPFSAGD